MAPPSIDLLQVQERLHVWREHNFPNADAEQQLLGMVEEVGELAKVVLKRKQRIRINLTGAAAEQDAIGDLLIYTMGYCSYMGWDLNDIIGETVEEVVQRDWITYPMDGRTR